MFKALTDLLFPRDGRTLTELESGLEMSRFGVMKRACACSKTRAWW